MPKLSVIVPVYNVEQYIDTCLESLVHQTYESLEIIVVDDGSTDGSLAIVKSYQERYPDLIQVFEKPNGGLSDARNFGLKHAKGTYIAFMDSDDWVALDCYEKLMYKALAKNADIVCTDIVYVYEGRTGEKSGGPQKGTIKREYRDFKEAMLDIFPMAQNKIWRRVCLEQYGMQFPMGLYYEDLVFFYQLYPLINKVSFVHQPLFYYRQRSGSITSTFSEKVMDIEAVFSQLITWYKEHECYEAYRDELEYLMARNYLVASFARILKAPDFDTVYRLASKLFDNLNSEFPKWRKNKYVRYGSGMRNLYLRHLRRWNLKLALRILYSQPWLVRKLTQN